MTSSRESRRTISSDPAQIYFEECAVVDDVVGASSTTSAAAGGTPAAASSCVVASDLDLDKSFRQLLPSESHLKKSAAHHRLLVDALMASMNMNSHDLSGGNGTGGGLADTTVSTSMTTMNRGGGGGGGGGGGFFEDDAFRKFTEELMLKYIREEETRARHHVCYRLFVCLFK